MSNTIDQNGIPDLGGLVGALAFRNSIGAMIEPETPSATFGSLVSDALDTIEDDALIVVDPMSRKVWVGDDASSMTEAFTDLNGLADHTGTLTPDTGQTGRTLTWTAVTTGLPAAFIAAINAAVATQKPARTIQSLVSTLLSDPSLVDDDVLPVISINQISGLVRIFQMSTAAEAETVLDAVANAGDRVKILLEEPPEGGSSPAPIFEGGSTGT